MRHLPFCLAPSRRTLQRGLHSGQSASRRGEVHQCRRKGRMASAWEALRQIRGERYSCASSPFADHCKLPRRAFWLRSTLISFSRFEFAFVMGSIVRRTDFFGNPTHADFAVSGRFQRGIGIFPTRALWPAGSWNKTLSTSVLRQIIGCRRHREITDVKQPLPAPGSAVVIIWRTSIGWKMESRYGGYQNRFLSLRKRLFHNQR